MSDKDVTILPDGSALATASRPLPKDHWLYAPRVDWDDERDEFAECPYPILTHAQRDAVVAAIGGCVTRQGLSTGRKTSTDGHG